MRTAVWSLAVLASVGPSFAFPGFNRGQATKEIASLEKEIKALEAQMAKLEAEESGWEKGGSNGQHTGQGKGQGNSGAAGNNNGRHSTSTKRSGRPVQTKASVQQHAPSTYAQSQQSSSASTSTAHGSSSLSSVAVAPVSEAAIPSGYSSLAAASSLTSSDVTSIYTTAYPTTSQYVSDGTTLTTSFSTTCTETTTYPVSASATVSSGVSSSVAGPATTAGSSTIIPVPYGSYTPSGYESSSSVSSSPTITPVPYGSYTPSSLVSPASTTVLDVTTTFDTTCTESSVYTSGSSTSTTTYTTVSTLTSTFQTTVTAAASSTESSLVSPVTASGVSSSASSASAVGSKSSSVSKSSSHSSSSSVSHSVSHSSTHSSSVSTSKTSTATSGAVSAASYGSGSASVSSSTTVSVNAVVGSSTSVASSSIAGPTPPAYGGSSSSSASAYGPTAPVFGGSSSAPAHSESSDAITTSVAVGSITIAANSTTSVPAGTGSLTTASETAFTTFTSLCTENGTITIHTHSQPVTAASNGTTSSTAAGPTGTANSTLVSPVTGTATSGTQFTTFTSLCTENGTTVVHTHSQPITTGYNGTASSVVAGPTGTGVSSNATLVSPVTGTVTSGTQYTTFTSLCTENGTTVVHTHSQPITTGYNGTTTSVAVGPTGTGSITGTAASGTHYTTFTSLCTENGTIVVHTHSAPVTTGYNATSVGAVPTGTGSSVASVSGPISNSANSTAYMPTGTGVSNSGTKFTTFTSLCTENGTQVVHTHSAPITAASGSPTYSANSTVYAPTGTGTSFTTFTSLCTENGTQVVHTHSAPITSVPSSTTVGAVGTGASSGIISSSANLTSSSVGSLSTGGSSGSVSYSANLTTSSATVASDNWPVYTWPTVLSTVSVPFPAGNSTTSAAGSAGTSSPTTISSFSTASTCTTRPTSTAACVACQGQPGSDPNSFCGLTAADNSYNVMPITCVTREYTFDITNTTLSPDGIERLVLVVNGQMPGPTIEANWGDDIVVHVTNSMQNNGSTIHWHGLRQNGTNEMDGVSSITQCPIAPGQSMTYRFKASNYGTSWYHSHFAIQTYEGVFGPMIIHGPVSTNQTIDAEQMITLQDWSHVPVDQMYEAAQDVGPTPQNGPRTLDTGLINGMNIWGDDGASGTTGERFSMTVTKGKTYKLRVLNTAIQSTFAFSIDGHSMTVIASDYVPIVPYTTSVIKITTGQRYDVLVTMDQDVGDYWMRSDNQQACATLTAPSNIKAFVHYEGGAMGVPTSTANTYTTGCDDELLTDLVPYHSMDAGAVQDQISETVLIGASGNLYKWSLSGTTFQSQWADPTLFSIAENGTVPTYSGNLAIEVPTLGEWVYVIIDSPIPVPHPIHLHGHDFYILAQGSGLYTSGVALNLKNPPRRDVAMMPGENGQGGHLVVAFLADNPGVWLMHCHIGWHAAMGFALQIIENLDGIPDTVADTCLMQETCNSWKEYAEPLGLVSHDAGI